MCYQDVKMGMRRWSKITLVNPGTGPVTLPADGKRVLLRISLFSNIAADAVASVRPANLVAVSPLMCVCAGNLNDEIWLERHGNILFGPFIAVSSIQNAIVMEVFDNYLAEIDKEIADPGKSPK